MPARAGPSCSKFNRSMNLPSLNYLIDVENAIIVDIIDFSFPHAPFRASAFKRDYRLKSILEVEPHSTGRERAGPLGHGEEQGNGLGTELARVSVRNKGQFKARGERGHVARAYRGSSALAPIRDAKLALSSSLRNGLVSRGRSSSMPSLSA